MAATLIVEDGSNVPNANSYVSLDDAKSYLSDRGLTVASDDDITAGLLQAMDYLSFQPWIGKRQYDDQPLDWPRVAIMGYRVPPVPTGIPANLRNAQIRLSYEVTQGNDLFPSTAGSAEYVTEETVGPLTTKYAKDVDSDGLPSFPLVDNLLTGLVIPQTGFQLRTYRI